MNTRAPFFPQRQLSLIIGLSLSLLGLLVSSQPLVADEKNIPSVTNDTPTAEILLQSVRSRMPRENMSLTGRLLRGGRVGRMEPAFRVEAQLEWDQSPPISRYTLCDAFGDPHARLIVTRAAGKDVQFAFETGKPLQSVALPDLSQPIESTELTWLDLSLSFLWWPGGEVVGRDAIRGRNCHVVEVPAPDMPASAANPQPLKPETDSSATQQKNHSPVASVRLWIDDTFIVPIQVEEYDAQGNRLRQVTAKTFKKIGEHWMIKNMDIRRYPSRHRAQIRIDEIRIGTDGIILPADDEHSDEE